MMLNFDELHTILSFVITSDQSLINIQNCLLVCTTWNNLVWMIFKRTQIRELIWKRTHIILSTKDNASKLLSKKSHVAAINLNLGISFFALTRQNDIIFASAYGRKLIYSPPKVFKFNNFLHSLKVCFNHKHPFSFVVHLSREHFIITFDPLTMDVSFDEIQNPFLHHCRFEHTLVNYCWFCFKLNYPQEQSPFPPSDKYIIYQEEDQIKYYAHNDLGSEDATLYFPTSSPFIKLKNMEHNFKNDVYKIFCSYPNLMLTKNSGEVFKLLPFTKDDHTIFQIKDIIMFRNKSAIFCHIDNKLVIYPHFTHH